LLGSPVKPSESADVLVKKSDRIEWYHRNETSFFDTILAKQNVSSLIGKYADPYLHRTFGAIMKGNGMQPQNDSTLASIKQGKNFAIAVYPYTAQTRIIDEWNTQLEQLVSNIDKENTQTAHNNHYAWWDTFWNRSWIFLSGDEDATKVTRAYLLQRFMMACQSRGAYPAKFNGGKIQRWQFYI
jgi:hypothetical protein